MTRRSRADVGALRAQRQRLTKEVAELEARAAKLREFVGPMSRACGQIFHAIDRVADCLKIEKRDRVEAIMHANRMGDDPGEWTMREAYITMRGAMNTLVAATEGAPFSSESDKDAAISVAVKQLEGAMVEINAFREVRQGLCALDDDVFELAIIAEWKLRDACLLLSGVVSGLKGDG